MLCLTYRSLGVCDPASQSFLVAVQPGTGTVISDVTFNHANFTLPSQAVITQSSWGPGLPLGQALVNFLLEKSRFINIPITVRTPAGHAGVP